MKERTAQRLQWIRRHGTWLVVLAAMVLVFCVRMRLRETPLERDEGEYAYAGQLLLQGVAPYQLAYNMKLPGTNAACALIFAVFGQTTAGLHTGLALVNAFSIILVFLLGRRTLDPITGATAAVVYALVSASPTVLGLAAHATHFVVLFALAATLLLLRAVETEKPHNWRFLVCGLLFGLAVMMKQHGVFFGLFGLSWLFWRHLKKQTARRRVCWVQCGLMLGGMAMPYVLTCLVLLAAGVFDRFIFWTIRYAGEYASGVTSSEYHDNLAASFAWCVSPNLPFLLLALAGLMMIWSERRLQNKLPFVLGFMLASALALFSGLYLRQHYFILVLPALALLDGIAVSRALQLIRHDKSVELLLAVAALVLLPLGIVVCLVGHGYYWFVCDPRAASQAVYGSSIFLATAEVADRVRTNSTSEARVVVLGSEPQIYFLSQRRSGTGYLYTYPLGERHRYVKQMHEEMIREIEQSRPEYIVFIQDNFSWNMRKGSEKEILTWWDAYSRAHYDLLESTKVIAEEREHSVPGGSQDKELSDGGAVLLYRRDDIKGREKNADGVGNDPSRR